MLTVCIRNITGSHIPVVELLVPIVVTSEKDYCFLSILLETLKRYADLKWYQVATLPFWEGHVTNI